MTNPMTDLDACTDEELEQELARVLAHARGEVLNDAEVQKFWQLNEEILRRVRHQETPRSWANCLKNFDLSKLVEKTLR